MLIINDLHLSVQRRAGTTPASQEALRTYLFNSLRRLLDESNEDHLLILGDLLDTFQVETRDWVETYLILSGWLGRGRALTLVAGNHDDAPKGEKVSSFAALGRVLSVQSAAVKVVGVGASEMVRDGVMAIAHHSNQDLFNQALEAALVSPASFHTLLLHCNFNNFFAQQADHSLDLSSGMAKRFDERGVKILLAHEHNSRVVGNVTVLGCQFVTSVSDCVASDEKFAHTMCGDGGVTKIRTWDYAEEETGYTACDWQDLDKPIVKCGFVRVTGTATAAQASEVVNAIAKFRQASSAFVVTNAVKVEGIPDSDTLPEQFEVAKRFDVMAYIKQHLTGEEEAVVDALLKEGA